MSPPKQLARVTVASARFVALATLFFIFSLPSCSSPSIGRAQFDRLKLGMTPTEVEEILGNGKPVEAGEVQRLLTEAGAADGDHSGPKREITEMRGVRWGSEKKSVTVIYKNDRLFRAFQQGL